jgi:hypothetical protein
VVRESEILVIPEIYDEEEVTSVETLVNTTK